MFHATAPSIEAVPMFSNGKWTELKAKRSGEVYNPSTGKGEIVASQAVQRIAHVLTQPIHPVQRFAIELRQRTVLGDYHLQFRFIDRQAVANDVWPMVDGNTKR